MTKTVLITGCSAGGIGCGLAEVFQRRGLHVFATARNVAKMAHLAELPNVTLLTLDVTSQASLAAAVDAVRAHTGGKLDYLVNNSGASYLMPLLDADIQTTRDMFEVNFYGTVATTQAFAPLVLAAKGTIVNIGSTAGHANAPWMGMYSATKAAQEAFSETLRLEVKQFGVNVMTVVAGAVKTNVTSNNFESKAPAGSLYLATPEELARKANNKNIAEEMPLAVFAERVVGDILRGATGRVWRGKFSTSIWFATAFLPQWLIDTLLLKETAGRYERAPGN